MRFCLLIDRGASTRLYIITVITTAFPGHPGIKKQEHDSLPLNLFMLRILANDPYLALSLNDFALLTDRLD